MVKLAEIFKKKLSAKAAVFFTGAVIMAAIFVVTISVYSDHQNEEENAILSAQNMAKSLSINATIPILERNTDRLQQIVSENMHHTALTDFIVVDTDGTSLMKGQADSADLSAGIQQIALSAISDLSQKMELHGQVLVVATPILAPGETGGAVVATFNLQQLVPTWNKAIQANLWKGLALIGVGIPLSLMAFQKLFAPLQELISVVERAANGDLAARVNVDGEDEFGVLGQALNIMFERMKTNIDRVRWLAYGDELTRLANKTAFNQRLRQLVDREKSSGTLFLIDLDGFKRLNDAYGAEQGDMILCTAANRLRQVAGEFLTSLSEQGNAPNPMLARLSGNEYAFLAPACVSAPLAQKIAQRVLDVFAEPFEVAGQHVNMSARIGIAMYPHDAADSKTLVGSVNFAIDVAKNNGGGTWQFFEPSMTQAAIRRVTLQNELQRALKNREFIVYYQPKINVRDGSTAGCEALVRWQKAPGKIVSPGVFIDVAEETGLINQIGDYVLEEACSAAARWADDGMPCSVAVNVSSLQFARENFSAIVGQVLEKTGLPHELLELELTESVAMTNPDRLMEQVMPLRDRGVRFAIDDFGTGHSSLSYLSRLPFDVFKIDQSFVREMTEDKHARVIVQTVLAMAESLGYRTVAEGVETREHFAFLQLHCCDYIQGYYFSRPLPEDEFVARLQQEKAGLEQRDNARLAS